MPDEIDLLRELVAIPSVSGEEAAVAAFVEETARRLGPRRACAMTTWRAGRGAGPGAGPTLALVSHLDVVPPGNGLDPRSVHARRSKAPGSTAAARATPRRRSRRCSCAAKDVADAGGLDAGRLLVLLGYGEETKNTTMEQRGRGRRATIDAAVVGEPTNLDFAVAQRGLMMVDLLAEGDQRHAGYAAADGEFRNAALVLARDLLKLDGLFAERAHPVLGRATATPTMLEAGVSRNVTPPVAEAVLDVRSTPDWTHEELGRGAPARARRPTSSSPPSRLVPCETPAGSRLLAAARRLRPEAAHVRQPDLLRLGLPPPHRRHQVRAGHQPAVAHAGRVRGPARSHRGARLLRRAGPRLPARGAERMARSRPRSGAPATAPDAAMFEYTAGDDRPWDARLLRWDVLGSLGHIEGLRAVRLLSGRRVRPAARGPARGARRGRRAAGSGSDRAHEDVHTAVEDWLTRRLPGTGERLHTGRSRNDQVACDLRLFLKDRAARAARRGARRWPTALLAFAAAAPRRALAGLHPPAPGDAVVGRALGRRATPKGCSTRSSRCRRSGPGWTARRSAARPATACRCRSSARRRRARSASPGWTATWPRCRAGGASSRRRCSSGAPSWATSSRGSRRT